jgi:hypothetical protein
VDGGRVTRGTARLGWHPARRLLLVFAAVSAAAFGLPAAFGLTWLVGDNLIQNFPLRVLVGTDLRHGHLPLWDPYLWSGSPLLAGFNAGAAYPTTVLFALVPGTLAWVLNQVTVEVVAAAGMMALLRVLGRSWLAAGLGAAAFTFGGFMAAQSVHLDLVQAAAWLPWAFVALDRLAHRNPERPAGPWVALLGASLGLMILSGAVEPILDGGIALTIYAVWLAWRTPGRRRLDVVAGSLAGIVIGLLLGAAQLLPGAAFQAQSQRAMHSFTYFSSGSMNKAFTLLGLDPLLLGGIHNWPFGFIGTFNLPEISSYIGILPVMGLLGLLARRHRRAPEAGQWWIWYVILVVGLFLAWGGFTPVAHLVYDIPLFNRQRLLNRNLLEVDLAAAVIFAIWIDRMFTPAPAPETAPVAERARLSTGPVAGGPGRRWPTGWTSDVVLPLIPPVAVVGLQLTLLIGGPWLPHALHAPGFVSRGTIWALIAMLTVPSAVAVAAAWIILRRSHLGARLPSKLVALVVVDLLVFNIGIQSTPDPGSANSASSVTANRLAALVAAQGQGPAGGLHRLGMLDPDGFYPVAANRIGQPDLTLLRSLDSVQGYGAVVNQRYDAETGTHLQLNLTPTALSGDKFAQLDLGLLVSVPEYFLHLVSLPPGSTASLQNGAEPLPPVGPDPSAPPDRSPPIATPATDYQFTSPPSPTATLTTGVARTQYFGTILSVTSVRIPLASSSGGGLRVGLVTADGRRTTWLGPRRAVAGRTEITVAAGRAPRRASGIVLLATSTAPAPGQQPEAAGSGPTVSGPVASGPVVVGDALVRTAGQGSYRLDGSLRDVVTSPRWRFVGMDGDFCVFAQPAAKGRAWIAGDAAARARVVSDTPWGDETIGVDTDTRATLVRSVQYISGWQATVTSVATAGHSMTSTSSVVVRRLGLIQSVTVPAGIHLVHFTYRPPRALEGLAVSALGILTVVLLGCWPLFTRRRRGREPV